MLRSELTPATHSNVSQPGSPVRFCAVHFLNTVPLIWGFLQQPERYPISLTMASPAVCAQRLREGAADVGLVPVAEIARQSLDVLPATCISSDGPVRSILLISRKPWREVRTLAGDANSRTSVLLAQIILRERFGVTVRMDPHPPDLEAMLAVADAAVVIGDPALHIDVDHLSEPWLDLGDEWRSLTSLPMVFAAWAGRDIRNPESLTQALLDSLAFGKANLDAIVENEAAKHGVALPLAREYLAHHIRFPLGERERAGMAEYLRLARLHGLLPSAGDRATRGAGSA